jgi:hypothetical protein
LITQKLLEKASRLAKADGFNVALFIIPTIYETESESYSELISAHRLTASEFNRDKPVETLMAILEREGILAINLLPEFRSRNDASGQQFYIQGDGHFNKLGHQLAASIIGSDLAGKIREWDTSHRCHMAQSEMPSSSTDVN